MSRRQRPRGRAIVAAIGVTVVVALIRAAASPWLGNKIAILPFLTSVLVAAWIGGFWPGILATALGGIAGIYFFVEPAGNLVPADPSLWLGISLFFVFGVAFSIAFEVLIRARNRSEEAQQALRESQALLATTFEQLPLGIGVVDREGRWTLTNGVMRTFVSTVIPSRDPSLSSRWRAQGAGGRPVPPDQWPIARALRGDRMGTGLEMVITAADGREIWTRVSAMPVVDDHGTVTGAVATIQDISELHRAEQVRRTHEAGLASQAGALAHLNDSSSRLWRMGGLHEGLEEMLAASIRLLGADMGNVQLLGADGVLRIAVHRGFDRGFLDFFSEVTTADDSACGRTLRSQARTVIDDVETDAAYAPLRPIARSAGYRAVQTTPLIGRDGKPLGMLSTHWRSVHRPAERDLRLMDLYARQAADFIERCAIDSELRESDRRKDEFLAVLAHELRNPLAPIRNAAHFLSLLDLPAPDLKRPVAMIERQVTHMTRLIDDLLDVSRMTTGLLQLRLQPVELNELVHAALEACRADIDSRAHAIRVTLPHPAVRVNADRDRLIQVLSNLVTNAAKYTPPHGSIALDARVDRDVLEVAVRDNGRGIPREKLAEVFELFVQVNRTLDGQGGLGIGLTLARQLVQLHGGTIEARSDGVDRGSTFVLRLPIVVGVTAPAAAHRSQPATDARRVLVVDDSRDAAESLALVLERAGHVTRVAFDGESALRAAAEFLPEVAFLDIGMPRLNGYELARRLRAEPWGRSIYLIALTGWGQESDQRRALEAGFDTHLVKPAAPEAVTQLLERTREAPAR